VGHSMRSAPEYNEAAEHYPGLKKQWIEFLGEHPDPAIDRIETSDVEAEPVAVQRDAVRLN
jgi:hypothetical protein